MVRLIREYDENNMTNLQIAAAKSHARDFMSNGFDPQKDVDAIISELENLNKSEDYIELVLDTMQQLKTRKTSYRIDYYGSWDNGHVLHSFKKGTLDQAENDARQASIKDPNNLYYVVLDNIMYPTTGWQYFKGEAYHDNDPELNTIKKIINNAR